MPLGLSRDKPIFLAQINQYVTVILEPDGDRLRIQSDGRQGKDKVFGEWAECPNLPLLLG